ncbi:MAG: hypothetical protein FWC50_06685 [Planctomycetaceae bacterium]|nr:hypothetical protein [Planctomycetaceae bacterium]
MTSTFTYDLNNWEDPVMQELHWQREEHAREFNYDVYAIAMDGETQGKAVREEWERRKLERGAKTG